ncbi:sulfite exporter TauE/SafE family protein [Terrihabitans rhizophilus]|uniref:Probable membrane transporter protein n=1 Tax=Terrihabitans rhizophilus TaxID=3092662 RepID=A0ABU4RUR0_9HYPH|nr:sulfite exporter TauE/SafE family protein [Terrihabitans sp. PJ23]MDX6806596.1 sulfite exporter TauE/SafE family protein [Terrihabitans sp. PJ23]
MSLFGIAAGDLAVLVGSMLAAGVASGVLAGMLGVGGGAVIVPVLYQLFTFLDVPDEVRMHLCVGTSLAVIIPTSIRSLMSHHRRGAVDFKALRIWAVPVAVGTALGTLLAALIPSAGLELAFAVFGIVIGLQMLVLGTRTLKVRDDLPGPAGMSAYGLAIGLFSSLIGIGGGSLGNIVFAIHGRSMHQAVGTGAGLGLLISVPGAIGFMIAGWPEMAILPPLSVGYVSAIGALLLAPVAMLTAPLGVRIAHGFSSRQLEIALGTFLLLMGARFLFGVLV